MELLGNKLYATWGKQHQAWVWRYNRIIQNENVSEVIVGTTFVLAFDHSAPLTRTKFYGRHINVGEWMLTVKLQP
jgi:hypothetical protein